MTRELLSMFFEDKSNLRVFEGVAGERTVRLKDLRESLDISSEEVLEALDRLEEQNLIKWQGSPEEAEDFRWYYITEEGLAAERQLHRLELAT